VTPEVPEPALPSRGWETILLVEDESALRAMVRQILDEHGYRVIEAASGAEAVEMSRNHPEPIHLLLTDVVMPGMNGRALAELLVPGRSDLGVLYMSGYSDDVLLSSGVLVAGAHLLEKPFTAQGLLDRVRAVIGARGAGGKT
jgi:two-component system, cell cycle sensor histidine kinase and response regulator CckA